jgi:hypothetical protein
VPIPGHAPQCATKTRPSTCAACGAGVFWLSCTCGSVLLLDALGDPWPLHRCSGRSQSARRRRTYGSLPDGQNPSLVRSAPGADLSVVGVVQQVRAGADGSRDVTLLLPDERNRLSSRVEIRFDGSAWSDSRIAKGEELWVKAGKRPSSIGPHWDGEAAIRVPRHGQ